MDEREKLRRSKEKWVEQELFPQFQKKKERKASFESPNGLPIDRLYTPLDWEGMYEAKLGFPGSYPYTRGVQPTMYRGRLWTMRQYAGFGTAAQTNKRFRFLLEKGQTGLSVAFDLPTQMGYDSDAEESAGEVGRVGVAIDSLGDMRLLMKGIDQGKVSTSMTINATAMVLIALYLTTAEENGIPRASLSGTVQNDILKEYVARGTYIFPPQPSMKIITDMFAFCTREMPRWNPISISGYHIREAGATAIEEIGFTLANAIAYVESALQAGLEIDTFAPRLSFFFNAHNSLFEEIAKFRAARRLWASIVKERFGAKNSKSLRLRFHAQTGGSTLTAQQPENNIVRVTLQALSAVLGGCQSLHCNAMDEALALPSAKAAQIALRTQQLLAEESGVASTIDPLGGAYFLENLTDTMEENARALIEEIDQQGGAVSAIQKGFMQRRILDSAYAYQQRIEKKDLTIVGVNSYEDSEPINIPLLELDPNIEKEQKKSLICFKRDRTQKKVARACENLKRTAESKANIMPAVIEAVRSDVTLGEICGTLREVFQTYEPTLVV